MWITRLRQLIPDDLPGGLIGLGIHVSERLPDPETLAAQTFLDALMSYHQGIQPEQSAILCFFDYNALAIGNKTAHMYVPPIQILPKIEFFYSSGASVGTGPIRAMYEHALSLFTGDASVWKVSQNDTVTWNIRAIPTNPLRLAKARTAGTLLAIGFTWFARTFHPISFWLSAFCVTASFDSLKCIDFICQIDEELGISLQAWPLDSNIPLISSSSLTALLANYLNTSVSSNF